MGMFTTRKPRAFRHEYVYVNERKEKLKEIEERAKRELGMIPPKECNPEDIRGTYVKATKHLRRRKESGKKPTSVAIILIVIAVLLFIWHWIVTGSVHF
jgi:hypothetical protein